MGVMVGEFGCHNQTPHRFVLSWMNDTLAEFKKAGFGWALWNFTGSFGVCDSGRYDVAYEDLARPQARPGDAGAVAGWVTVPCAGTPARPNHSMCTTSQARVSTRNSAITSRWHSETRFSAHIKQNGATSSANRPTSNSPECSNSAR